MDTGKRRVLAILYQQCNFVRMSIGETTYHETSRAQIGPGQDDNDEREGENQSGNHAEKTGGIFAVLFSELATDRVGNYASSALLPLSSLSLSK